MARSSSWALAGHLTVDSDWCSTKWGDGWLISVSCSVPEWGDDALHTLENCLPPAQSLSVWEVHGVMLCLPRSEKGISGSRHQKGLWLQDKRNPGRGFSIGYMPMAMVAESAKATEAPLWPPEPLIRHDSPSLLIHHGLTGLPDPPTPPHRLYCYGTGRGVQEGGDLSHVCSRLVPVFPYSV